VTRMDAARWVCGLKKVVEVFPDRTGAPRSVVCPAVGERRYDEATISEPTIPQSNLYALLTILRA